MDKYYVLVTGSGVTTRANVEALVEDYIYASGPDVTFVLSYNRAPSQGQVFVSQLAKDKGKDIMVFAQEGAKFDSIPSSSAAFSDTPTEDAITFLQGQSSVAFILWNDEDETLLNLLANLKKAKINCFDLTEGLNVIKPPAKSAPEIQIPEAELVAEPSFEIEEETDEEDEDDNLDILDDEELNDEIYFGIQALIKAIAREVVKELQDAPKKPSRGSRK